MEKRQCVICNQVRDVAFDPVTGEPLTECITCYRRRGPAEQHERDYPTQKPESQGRFMTVAECAAYLGRTADSILDLVDKGQIPHIRFNQRIQLDREALDRWMATAVGNARLAHTGHGQPRKAV